MIYSRDYILGFSVLHSQVKLAANKNCSKEPDSLGDKLVRLSLKMSFASSKNNYSTDLMIQANKLLTLSNQN